MQDHDLVFLKVSDELVGFCLSLGEDYRPVFGVESLDELKHSLVPLLLLDHERVVLYSLGSSDLLFSNEVDFSHILEISTGDFCDPRGNCGRKHQILSFTCSLAHLFHDPLYVQFETLLEHGVCLIQANCFQIAEIYGLSIDEIDKSAWGGHNYGHALLYGSDLIRNRGPPVDTYGFIVAGELL